MPLLKKGASFLLGLLSTIAIAGVASFAFPNDRNLNGGGILIFFIYIPIFLIINKSKIKALWIYGVVYGYLFYTFYGNWLSAFHPMANYIVSILESLQYLLLFPLLKLVYDVFPRRKYLAQSIVLTSYYYITLQGFLGFPYGTPASALWNYPILIQSASIFGLWGISLLILIPQAMIAEMITENKIYKKDMIIYLIVFIMNLSIGAYTINKYEKAESDRTIRIAAIQHSADTWEGGYSTYTRNFNTLKKMSLEALEEDPDFIVWSETAFVPSVAWHKAYPTAKYKSDLCDKFVEFGKSLPVPLITGNPESVIKDPSLPAILEDGSWNEKTYNTVILFGDGDILGTYRKQRLVPFTEHFPYEKELPRLHAFLLSHDYNWWAMGDEATVFEYDGIKFSTPICFEDTFGYLSAGFASSGADILINLSNDCWSGSVAAEMQHLQLAVFRAIENRIPMIRGTNSGITCLIDINGNVINPLEPFAEDWGIYDVELGKRDGLTFYSKHPDLLAKILTVLSALIYVYMVASKTKAMVQRIRARKIEKAASEEESGDNINAQDLSYI